MENKKLTYILVGLLSFINSWQIVFGSSTITQIIYLAFLSCYLITIFSMKYYHFNLVKVTLFLILIIVVFVTNGFSTLNLITSAILIITSFNLDKKQLIRALIAPRFFLFTITILLAFIGLIPNNVIYRETANHIILNYRFSLGFNHPNTLFWFIFPAYMGYLYLKERKIKLCEIIIHIIVFSILFYYTDCRTGYFIILIAQVLVLFYKYFPKITSKILSSKFLRFSIIVFAIISIIVPIAMDNGLSGSIIDELDSILSYRLSLSAASINKFGYSLLGMNITYEHVIDNLYIYIFQSFGVLFTGVYIISSYFFIKRLQSVDKFLVFFIILFALYSCFEKVYFNVLNNFTLLFYSLFFLKKCKSTYSYSLYIKNSGAIL